MRITGKMKAPVFLAALVFLTLSSVFAEKAPEKVVPDPPDVPKMNTQHWVPARYKVVREQLLGKECGVLFVGDSSRRAGNGKVRNIGRSCSCR